MKKEVQLISDADDQFEYQKIRQQEYRQTAASRWPLLNVIDQFLASLPAPELQPGDGSDESDGQKTPGGNRIRGKGRLSIPQSHSSKIRFVRWPS